MEKTESMVPAEYFEWVKSRKHIMDEHGLERLYNNCLQLLGEFERSGQVAAAKKIIFHLDTLAKEAELQKLGFNIYIYKTDVDDYLDKVKDRVVKVIELENYTRRIPEDIIQKIEKVRGIFDEMYVVFTDYTRREERKVEAVYREKDPILFGTFQSQKELSVIERFYFIGDWVDEFCDLTLDKMVSEIKAETGVDVRNKIDVQTDVEGLRKSLDNLTDNVNGLYRDRTFNPERETWTGRLKRFFGRRSK